MLDSISNRFDALMAEAEAEAEALLASYGSDELLEQRISREGGGQGGTAC